MEDVVEIAAKTAILPASGSTAVGAMHVAARQARRRAGLQRGTRACKAEHGVRRELGPHIEGNVGEGRPA